MNNEVRVLGKLISHENLHKYSGGNYSNPIFRNKNSDNVVIIEEVSDLPEEFGDRKYGYCNAEYIKKEYGVMGIEKIEDELKSKYISFTPKKFNENNDKNTYLVYNPRIEGNFKENQHKTFVPLPYIDLDKLNLEIKEFEQIIDNGKLLNIVPQIPDEESYTPPIFVVKKNKTNSVKPDNFIYGKIENIEFKYNGIIIKFDKSKVEKYKFPEELYNVENIIYDTWNNSNIIFIDNETVGLLESLFESNKIDESLTNSGVNNVVKTTKEEKLFIEVLTNNAQKEGLLYDKNDLINFHIALKSSGLVILSGMSGTGKSKLINLYAKTLGLNNRFRMIPVSPVWTDDSDLLGYLDYKNMIYRPADTDLVNFLLKAQDDPENLYIVCFDEMNLARVEHYFSQFISVLENSDDERYIQLYNSNLENRVYNSNTYPSKILVRKNVIFVGTVNVDESTFHFSDKVLDRANVIKLKMRSFNELVEVNEKNSLNDIENINFTTKDFFENDNKLFTMTKEKLNFLDELNSCLKDNNPRMGIGYRVISQINQYLSAIPVNIGYSRQEAFDNLIVQRVLTKLRGADDQIIKLIGNLSEENKLDNSLLCDLFDKYLNVSEFKHCKDVLCQKAKELKLYGYTI